MRQAHFLLPCALLAATCAIAQTNLAVIDGRIDDPVWKSVPAQHLEPAGGGEIRAIISGQYMLLSARLPEQSGRVVARVTGRHPDWEDEDILQVTFGPDIGFTDRVLKINPFGAFSVVREGQEVYHNSDQYLIATSVGEKEWFVEAALPLKEVGAPGPEPILASVVRIRAVRPGSPKLQWRWPRYDPATRVAVDRSVPWDGPRPEFRAPLTGNQDPPLGAARQTIPPADSGWDDEPWSRVASWELRRNQPGGPPADFGTEVKAVHDGKTLAVLARCQTPPGDIARGESFQLYFGTSGSAYVRISTDPSGSLSAVTGKTGGPRVSRPRNDWDSGARSSSRAASGYWLARIDVPLEPLSNILGETSIPSELRVLFARVRPGRTGELAETSALPVVPAQTLLGPARYRRLDLTGDADKVATRESAAPRLDTRVWNDAERARRKPAEMLHTQLRTRVTRSLEAEAEAWRKVESRADWENFRTPRVEALRKWIGTFPERVPLNVIEGKQYSGAGYRRHDVVYQSRPGLWIAANLYLPDRPAGRIPAIIIVPSHHRARGQAELQDMGVLWARAGSAVLVADNIGEGERLQTYPWNREGYHSRYNMGLQLNLSGESLIKWMVWDIMRSVDLLQARPEVDSGKIILLGAVAGGGDPAAVAAALDERIAAVAPFNFGEATPEHQGRANWPEGLADPGWGSWETTRNLPRSIVDQYLPWLINASVAPRRLIAAYEMGWEIEKQPVWRRYQKVFGFYNALDRLDEAHGFGGFPGPGECSNIGPSQRKTLYPELQRWFSIPPPQKEPDERWPEADLNAYTPEVAAKAPQIPVHRLAGDIASGILKNVRATLEPLDSKARLEWLRREWSGLLGSTEPEGVPAPVVNRTGQFGSARVEAITVETEPGISVPILLLKPDHGAPRGPIVLAVANSGKEAIWRSRAKDIRELLSAGVAVCLADVRGTGETAPDRRWGPHSREVSLHQTELMLGSSLLAGRVKDVRSVLAYLRTRPDVDATRLALWGDSHSPANPARLLLDESPGWQIGPDVQYEADPLGALLVLFTALYEPGISAVAAVGGLVSFESMFEDAFPYVPGHVIVPGMLRAGDLPDLTRALAGKPLLMHAFVDAKNRPVFSAEAPDLPRWFSSKLITGRQP
jgi:cephalosporin-C deacetylase-like acetyl esterase